MSSTTSGVFWDASALVKGYAQEEGTPNVKSAFALPDIREFVTEFVALEVITALGKKYRTGQITKKVYRNGLDEFRHDFDNEFDVLELERRTREHSLRLAEKYQKLGTSALDILHLASARQAAALCHPRPLVVLCADKPLIEAARAEGLGVYNPETHPHAALRTALSLRS
ncbi:MAG TPA: type II toxin-antitoxin system VapC family toxin [Longimicrobium sp.]|nr:type II toxin-antitoxin system VapC family toxin [Longimicrobium sp.]